MSGIRSGTRLEQLHDLRQQITLRLEHARRNHRPATDLLDLADAVDHEIRSEGGTPPPPPPERSRRRLAPHRADVLLNELGVTAAVVRAWAIEHGLLDGVHRGRIASRYVEAYAAHERTVQHAREVEAS